MHAYVISTLANVDFFSKKNACRWFKERTCLPKQGHGFHSLRQMGAITAAINATVGVASIPSNRRYMFRSSHHRHRHLYVPPYQSPPFPLPRKVENIKTIWKLELKQCGALLNGLGGEGCVACKLSGQLLSCEWDPHPHVIHISVTLTPNLV
jgi:hypothetical protein